MMNKKAQEDLSIKQVIGFVLVALVLFAFVGFTMKLWNVFSNKPNEATINSFENLVHELNTLEEGKEKIVPYFIQDGYYLRTSCDKIDEKVVRNDVCICRDAKHCNRLEKRVPIIIVKDIVLLRDSIGYDKEKEVINLKIVRTKGDVTIAEA